MASVKLPAHEHKLYYLDTTQLFATKGIPFWGCDACRRTSREMQVTHSYRCMSCDFDICEECSAPVKNSCHTHKLAVTDTKRIYPNGAWSCDNCTTNFKNQGPLSWHCESGCAFDLCFGCTRSHKSLAHPHILLKVNARLTYPTKTGWRCDVCQTSFKHESPEKPYQCKACHFDLCFKCLKETYDIKQRIVEVPEAIKPQTSTVSVTDGGAPFRCETDEDRPPSVFISYNWNIQDKVLELKRNLESMNIKCWMDTGNMVGGDDLKKEIDKGMRGSKIVISCVTKAYSQSNACQQEVALADVLKKPILPVLFESITWPPEGPMAMPFAPLIYVSLEDGLTRENLNKVIQTIKSKTQ